MTRKDNGSNTLKMLVAERNINALSGGMEAQGKEMSVLYQRLTVAENELATLRSEMNLLRGQLASILNQVGNVGPTG